MNLLCDFNTKGYNHIPRSQTHPIWYETFIQSQESFSSVSLQKQMSTRTLYDVKVINAHVKMNFTYQFILKNHPSPEVSSPRSQRILRMYH